MKTLKALGKRLLFSPLPVALPVIVLGAALLSAGLIEGSESEYGLFVTKVDGMEANSANEEWWCLTKGGEAVMTGVDSTPVADGDKFEFTLTVGY